MACLCVLCGTLFMASCDSDPTPAPSPKPGEDEGDLCALVKWESSDIIYFMNLNGYLLYQPGREPRADCKIDSSYFHLKFDQEGQLLSINGSLLQMYAVTDAEGDKDGSSTLYVNAYGKSFTLTASDAENGHSPRKENASAVNSGYWIDGMDITLLQMRGLEKALAIEAALKDSQGVLDPGNASGESIRKFLEMARTMSHYMRLTSKSSDPVASSIESVLPERGKVAYAVGGTLGLSSSSLYTDDSQVIGLFQKWKEDIQGGCEALASSRTDRAQRPLLLFGVSTSVVPADTSCAVQIGGTLMSLSNGNYETFSYGVCITEAGASPTKENLHKIDKFQAGRGTGIHTISLPGQYVVGGLKPGTEYTCRFYCQSWRDHTYIMEERETRFTTNAQLDCKNDAAIRVLSATYHTYGQLTQFTCLATATKPSLDHIADWGVCVGTEFCPVSSLDATDQEGDKTFVVPVAKSAFSTIDVARHRAEYVVPVSIWVQLEGENFKRISASRDVTLVYDQPASVSFSTDCERTVGENSTDYVKTSDGTMKHVELVGMPWVYYRVKYQVTGALFIDKIDLVGNQYEYGPTSNYKNGLLYSGAMKESEQMADFNDGDNTVEISNVECPSGSYTIEGKSYQADAMQDNWRWIMYRSNGQAHATERAVHYLTFVKTYFKFADDYSQEYETFQANGGY